MTTSSGLYYFSFVRVLVDRYELSYNDMGGGGTELHDDVVGVYWTYDEAQEALGEQLDPVTRSRTIQGKLKILDVEVIRFKNDPEKFLMIPETGHQTFKHSLGSIQRVEREKKRQYDNIMSSLTEEQRHAIMAYYKKA